jgi:hypothetical protein
MAACEDHNWRDGFRGRSDLFVYRDINRDDRITRPEWERRYGTVINDPMIVWFDELDCERDGVLTWKEYYHNLFLMKYCSPGPDQFPSGFRDENLRSGNTLGHVTVCDADPDFQRAIRSHREKELARARIEGVEIQCAAPVLGRPPYIGYVMGRCSSREDGELSNEQAYYSRISIRNKNVDATVSAVTLSIALSSAESMELIDQKHLKAVSVPPGSVQVVTAWFSNDVAEPAGAEEGPSLNCELHSALGY